MELILKDAKTHDHTFIDTEKYNTHSYTNYIYSFLQLPNNAFTKLVQNFFKWELRANKYSVLITCHKTKSYTMVAHS